MSTYLLERLKEDIRNSKDRNQIIKGIYDNLIGGNFGDNCMLLDSYMDADCSDPEKLPDWFKEYPVVLEDRDLVYKYKKK